MNPFQYQQQQQLQYPQQYGQQQVQFVPAYTYNIQPQANQQVSASGQYGGQQPLMSLYPSVTPEAQLGQSQGHPQVYAPVFTGQTQMSQTYQPQFAGVYQFQQQPSANLQPADAVTASSASSTTFEPPPMSFPSISVASSGGQSSLEDINQKYTEQYQKWQKQYNEWQAQHANHPDQKLFQEYQNQVLQWQQQQQQQQQMIQAQGIGYGLQAQALQATPNQTVQQHSQPLLNSSVNPSSQVPPAQQAATDQQLPSMQFHDQSFNTFINQNKDNKPNFAGPQNPQEQKGPNQWQQKQQQKQSFKKFSSPSKDNKPNFAGPPKPQEIKGPNQWQQKHSFNMFSSPNKDNKPNFASPPKPEERKEHNLWQQSQHQNQFSRNFSNQDQYNKPSSAGPPKPEERKVPYQWQQKQQQNQPSNTFSNQDQYNKPSSAGPPKPEERKVPYQWQQKQQNQPCNTFSNQDQYNKPSSVGPPKPEERKVPYQWQQKQQQNQPSNMFSNQDQYNKPSSVGPPKPEERKVPYQWQQKQQQNQPSNTFSNQDQYNKPSSAGPPKPEERKVPYQWQQKQQNQPCNTFSNQDQYNKPSSTGPPKPEERKVPYQWQQKQQQNQPSNTFSNQDQYNKPSSVGPPKPEERKVPYQWQQKQQQNQPSNTFSNQDQYNKPSSAGPPKPEERKVPYQWQQKQQQNQPSNTFSNQDQYNKPNVSALSKKDGKKGPNQWQQQPQQHNQQGVLSQNSNIRSNQTSQVSDVMPKSGFLRENNVQHNFKNDNKPLPSLPKWMQADGNKQQEHKMTDVQPSMPKWLQGNLKSPAPEEEKMPLPKWLQDSNPVKTPEKQAIQGNVNKQQQQKQLASEPAKEQVQEKPAATETKPLPKWLQDTKPTTSQTSVNTETVTTKQTESSQAQQISLTKAISTASSVFSGLLVKKLDPKQELELLQKQSIQLLQLSQLEKKQKESKSETNEPLLQKPTEAEQKTDANITKIQATPPNNLAPQNSSSNLPVQDKQQGEANVQSTMGNLKDDVSKPQMPNSKLKSVPCRFFPNCRNGAKCKFLHPPCTLGKSCTTKDCVFDHTDLPAQVPGNESTGSNFENVSKKDVQIPGIGDSTHYVKPTADAEERSQSLLKDPSVEDKNHVPPEEVRNEIGGYPEERRGEEQDRWPDDEWECWKNERDRGYSERDERMIPPREEFPPRWDDRERAYPLNTREEWEKAEREGPWRENWGRSADWASERERQHPSRDEEYARWYYEDERWKRRHDDWDYPPYREDRSRPPLSPRYRSEPEFDRERYHPQPYYDEGYRNEPPPRGYEHLDRYRRPRSPPPEEYDRRKEWEDREREYYWPRSREPDWRDTRDRLYDGYQSDRYGEDYGRSRRGPSPPLDPSRPPMYDRQRYRDYPPDYDRRDASWDRREEDWDMHQGWRRNPEAHQEDVGYRDRHPPREPVVQHEKKTAVVVPVETILDKPGRDSRPDRIVIILRGLPGSGKTHVARLVKDKEAANGAHAPRIISLDDYFLTEVEKQEKDPDTGKRVKKKVTEYLYEAEMEDTYRASMFKSFSKTLEDGFFPVVLVDAINNKAEHFDKYWSLAKQKGFEVYIAELSADSHVCAKRNSHNRTFEEISKIQSDWEESPTHMLRLDVRSLLQDAVITEVEMETADESAAAAAPKEIEKSEANQDNAEEEEEEGGFKSGIQLPQRSKWDDMDSSAEAQLNKLDGIRPLKRKREASPPLTLSDDEDPYDEKEEDMRIGKKRVRWADLEERKHMEHRRRIGFCIGTDWSLLTDPNAKIPEH